MPQSRLRRNLALQVSPYYVHPMPEQLAPACLPCLIAAQPVAADELGQDILEKSIGGFFFDDFSDEVWNFVVISLVQEV